MESIKFSAWHLVIPRLNGCSYDCDLVIQELTPGTTQVHFLGFQAQNVGPGKEAL